MDCWEKDTVRNVKMWESVTTSLVKTKRKQTCDMFNSTCCNVFAIHIKCSSLEVVKCYIVRNSGTSWWAVESSVYVSLHMLPGQKDMGTSSHSSQLTRTSVYIYARIMTLDFSYEVVYLNQQKWQRRNFLSHSVRNDELSQLCCTTVFTVLLSFWREIVWL